MYRSWILRLARENDWGYTRILGELRKLGIQSVSRNTVKNILKANGLDPGPQRAEALQLEGGVRIRPKSQSTDFSTPPTRRSKLAGTL